MAKRTPESSATGTPRKRTTKKPNGDATAPTGSSGAHGRPSEDDIRLRAYHRYLERGGGHGADFDDWVEAEKDLKSSRS